MTKITKKLFKVALESSNGTRVDMSKRLKVTRGAVTIYLSKHPDMNKLLEKKRLSNIDRAEAEIFSQLEFEDDESPTSAANIRQEHKGEQIRVIIEEKKPDGNKHPIKS